MQWLYEQVGGRKMLLVLSYVTLIMLNDVFGWGIAEAALDRVAIGGGAFVGLEGARDVVSAAKEKWPEIKAETLAPVLLSTDEPTDDGSF